MASNIYDVDSRTIRRWCEAGRLKAIKTPGGHWRIFIPRAELAALIDTT